MAYTNQDLSDVQAAITAHATGSRVVQAMDGGKLIKYSELPIGELKQLALQIELALQTPTAPCLRVYAKNGGRG